MLVCSGVGCVGVCILLLVYPGDCGMWLIVPYVIFGIWFAMYSAAMWPAIPMIVEKHMMGMAYGLVNAANNLGLALYPFLFGYLNSANTPEAYDHSILGLVVLAVFGMFACFATFYLARKDPNKDAHIDFPEWQLIKEKDDARRAKQDGSTFEGE
jgi:MFS family permease